MGARPRLRLHGRELGAGHRREDLDILQPQRLYEATGRKEECDAGIQRLKDARTEFLSQFPSLSEEIVDVSQLGVSAGEVGAWREHLRVSDRAAIDRFLASPALSRRHAAGLPRRRRGFASWLRKRGARIEDVDAAMLAAYAAELASARAGRQPRKLTRATIARKLAAVRGLLRSDLGPGECPTARSGLGAPAGFRPRSSPRRSTPSSSG